MFTGIIESTGLIREIIPNGSNKSFWIESAISNDLKPDESVNHNGVCLTVEEINNNNHKITAIEETLSKTTLNLWKVGDPINLESCLSLNGKLNGHLVQGHVDTTIQCLKRKEKHIF
jgi:riboflavin synthase